jgi:hypothetical protein
MILAISAFGCLLLGLGYGLFAGRYGRFPIPVLIKAKGAVERLLRGRDPRWQREFFEDVTSADLARCRLDDPIVILTGGQSNAANDLSDPVDADAAAPAFMFFDGNCYLLKDPVLGASGRRGSLWTALGHRLTRETGRSVVFINGAAGGTSYRDWLDDRSGFFSRLRTQALQAEKQNLRPNVVLWHQGETDADREACVEEYESDLQELISRLEKEIPLAPDAKIVLYGVSVSNCSRQLCSNSALRQAQRNIIGKFENVIAGPDTDALGGRSRYDDCHFNGRGRDEIVAETVQLLCQLPIISQKNNQKERASDREPTTWACVKSEP